MFKGIFSSLSKLIGKLGKALKAIGQWLRKHWKVILIIAVIVAIVAIAVIANWAVIATWFATHLPTFTSFMKALWTGVVAVGSFVKNVAVSAGQVLKSVFEKTSTIIGKAVEWVADNPGKTAIIGGAALLKPKVILPIIGISALLLMLAGGKSEVSTE